MSRPNSIRPLVLTLGLVALASCHAAKPLATSSAPPSPTLAALASPSASPAPLPSASASPSAPAAPILADDVCTAISATTIDSILGIHVAGGRQGSGSCSWQSLKPAGSLQLVRVPEAQFRQQLALLENEPKVSGIGIRAFGFSQGGLRPPAPPSGGELVVDFGAYAIYEHFGGPNVTIGDAVEIARLVSTPG